MKGRVISYNCPIPDNYVNRKHSADSGAMILLWVYDKGEGNGVSVVVADLGRSTHVKKHHHDR